MWGTDAEWLRVAMHLCLDENSYTKTSIVIFLDANQDKREYAKRVMLDHGVWEQAQQIAREMDLNIEP